MCLSNSPDRSSQGEIHFDVYMPMVVFFNCSFQDCKFALVLMRYKYFALCTWVLTSLRAENTKDRDCSVELRNHR